MSTPAPLLRRRLQYAIDLLRMSIGLILGWAFADKLWGLGFDTCADDRVFCSAAWLSGGSPTTGFLQFGTSGPLQEVFSSMAGNATVDWLFMLGLLFGGVALVLGIGTRLAAVGGSLLFLMMYLASFPPTHNPFVSDHVVYILALIIVGLTNDSQRIGLGRWWQRLPFVQRYALLK